MHFRQRLPFVVSLSCFFVVSLRFLQSVMGHSQNLCKIEDIFLQDGIQIAGFFPIRWNNHIRAVLFVRETKLFVAVLKHRMDGSVHKIKNKICNKLDNLCK